MQVDWKADPLPLTQLPDGTIRVAGTRVGLDLVIWDYQQGHSPEEIVGIRSTLDLADVYTIIGFYLKHRDEVDAYIRWYDEEGKRVRLKAESTPEYQAFRHRYKARVEVLRRANAPAGD